MIQFLKRLFKKEDEQGTGRGYKVPWILGGNMGGLGSRTQYRKIVQEAYYVNAISYRCIGLVSQALAHLPIIVTRNDKEVPNSPVTELMRRPNILEDRNSFLERLVIVLLLGGSGYILGRGLYDGKIPKELWGLLPTSIKPYHPAGELIPRRYEYSGQGVSERFLFDPVKGRCDIIAITKPDPLGGPATAGYSPTLAAGAEIDIRNEGNKWNYNLMRKSARPPGGFRLPQDADALSEEEFDRLKQDIRATVGGSENAGDILLLQGGMEWQSFGYTPTDMDWTQGRINMARDICAVYGVPAQMVGIPDTQTYSNYKEARQSLYEDTVLPFANKVLGTIGDALNRALPANQKVDIQVDVDQVEALAPKRQSHWDRVESSTVLTINEKRAELGYEPVDGGDEIYQSPNQVPLSMLEAGIALDFSSGGEETTQSNTAALETRNGMSYLLDVLKRLNRRELTEDEAVRELANRFGLSLAGATAIIEEVQGTYEIS